MASNNDPSFGFGFGLAIATVFWCCICAWYFWNMDTSAAYAKRALEYGNLVCSPHDGLEGFDNGGDFTCNDGTIIQKAGSKPDKADG